MGRQFYQAESEVFMVESINSSVLSSALSELQSSSSSSSTNSSKVTSKNDIVSELKRDSLSSQMTAQEIADEYGISLSEAQEVYDELHSQEDDSGLGYSIDNPIPEGSTVSYHV